MRKEETGEEIKIHKIIDGPFNSYDDPDYDGEDDFWWILSLVEYDGTFAEMELSSYDFNEMYKIVKHMNSPTIEPYILRKLE